MVIRDESSLREALTNPPTTLAEYLAILRRRMWFIIAVPVLTALAAWSLSNTQAPVYQAHAQILVNRAGIVTAIANIQDPATYDATRYLTTQSSIARSPALAARVVAAAGVPGLTPGALLGISRVVPRADADLLDVSVSYSDRDDTVVLVNAYARQFVRYKTALDTANINNALRVIRTQMATLQDRGQTNSPAYETLIQYRGQLETIGKLQANNTSVLRVAEGAGQIAPRPKQDLLLGGLIGTVLGLGLAFLLEALDRRVRSSDEIEAILGLPLLGRVSRPSGRLRSNNTLAMLSEPMSAQAETFRKLRTTIEFANLERGARTFLFTSAVQREGKSTTVANLAIAFARAGRRVALVDLDLRRPSLHSYFDVHTDHGIADVIVKHEEVARALQQVTLPTANPMLLEASNGRTPAASRTRWASPRATFASAYGGSRDRRDDQDTFHFLASGAVQADGEFFQSERVSAVLAELGEAFDVVLVDAPPFLAVGDAMSLTASVDAIVVVTSLETRRPMLRELERELHHCNAPCLGFILTGVPVRDGYGSGYGYGYGANSDRDGPMTGDIEHGIEPIHNPPSPDQAWGNVARGRPS